jgi:hypothetical protein
MALQHIGYFLIAADIVVCVITTLMGGRHPDLYFLEGQYVTWLSSMHLVAIGALSLGIFTARRYASNPGLTGARFWLLAALGSFYLALDEAFEFHEKLGLVLRNDLGIRRPPFLHGHGDIPVVGYAIVVVAVCWLFRREIVRDRRALVFFAVGVAILVLAEIVDVLFFPSGRQQIKWQAVVEESSKLIGFGFMFTGFLQLLQDLLAAALKRANGFGAAPPAEASPPAAG